MKRLRAEGRVLSLVLILGLAACADEQADEPEAPSATAEPAPGASPPPAEAPAASAPERPRRADRPGSVPETRPVEVVPAEDEPAAEESFLAAERRAAEEHRAVCEAQRVNNPGENYRVECTRAVVGDDRRDVYQCTCIWGG